MRLDKYLKVSRIIKRRTVANEACDAGRVVVNGKIARASYDVKVNDVIELTLGARTVTSTAISRTFWMSACTSATSASDGTPSSAAITTPTVPMPFSRGMTDAARTPACASARCS